MTAEQMYPPFYCTADVVALSFIAAGPPQVLLVKRASAPFKDWWALPGGYVEIDEKVAHAAVRELLEETGVDIRATKLTPVGTYSDPGRDPRGRIVSFAYTCITDPHVLQSGDDAAAARWWPVAGLPLLAFDHSEILLDALYQTRY